MVPVCFDSCEFIKIWVNSVLFFAFTSPDIYSMKKSRNAGCRLGNLLRKKDDVTRFIEIHFLNALVF